MDDLSFLESTELDKNSLNKLSEKVNNLKRIRKEIAQHEEMLKELKKLESTISGEEIPSFMAQFGIDSLTLDDGSGLTIKEDLSVSLPKLDPIKRKLIMDWISENGGRHLIKDNVTIEDVDETIMEALQDLNCYYTRKKDINPQSLKAFFRDLLGMKKNTVQKVELTDIPVEANLFVYRETKIK